MHIGLPSELFRYNNTIIFDTPGLDDVKENISNVFGNIINISEFLLVVNGSKNFHNANNTFTKLEEFNFHHLVQQKKILKVLPLRNVDERDFTLEQLQEMKSKDKQHWNEYWVERDLIDDNCNYLHESIYYKGYNTQKIKEIIVDTGSKISTIYFQNNIERILENYIYFFESLNFLQHGRSDNNNNNYEQSFLDLLKNFFDIENFMNTEILRELFEHLNLKINELIKGKDKSIVEFTKENIIKIVDKIIDNVVEILKDFSKILKEYLISNKKSKKDKFIIESLHINLSRKLEKSFQQNKYKFEQIGRIIKYEINVSFIDYELKEKKDSSELESLPSKFGDNIYRCFIENIFQLIIAFDPCKKIDYNEMKEDKKYILINIFDSVRNIKEDSVDLKLEIDGVNEILKNISFLFIDSVLEI